jgi:hypothetical protein
MPPDFLRETERENQLNYVMLANCQEIGAKMEKTHLIQ